MRFQKFINESTKVYLELTKIDPGLCNVAYASNPTSRAGFSKGTVSLSKVMKILGDFDYENNPLPNELKDKLDTLLFIEAQKDIHK